MESLLPKTTTSNFSLDLETLLGNCPPASKGHRFINILIDSVVIYIGICMIITLFWAIYFLISGFRDISSDPGQGNILFIYEFGGLWLLTGFLYYGLMEGFCGGRTIGKFCTRTKVVSSVGQAPISLKSAFLRALCRMVPLELFSGFGNPWHDRWTGTTVVKITGL